jgi:hypothetical protein
MMGKKSNRGPINTGPENIPGSGFKKKPVSPFDGLVKPTPVFGAKINGNTPTSGAWMRMATQKEWEESQRVAASTMSHSEAERREKERQKGKPNNSQYTNSVTKKF